MRGLANLVLKAENVQLNDLLLGYTNVAVGLPCTPGEIQSDNLEPSWEVGDAVDSDFSLVLSDYPALLFSNGPWKGSTSFSSCSAQRQHCTLPLVLIK